MKTEEIIIHCLIFFTQLVILVLLYQVRNYLKSKPLGLQTPLDDLVKDGMWFLVPTLISAWITWIKVVPIYNHYVAMSIVKIELFLRMAFVVQGLTFSVIRYLFVFHFNFINDINEKRIKNISRTFRTFLALICIIFDDLTVTKKYLYLTQNDFTPDQEEQGTKIMLSLIIVIISICAIVLVQARIVLMKWNNPEQPDHCTNDDDSYDLTTISAAVLIIVLAFCFVIIGVLVRRFMLLRRLIGI